MTMLTREEVFDAINKEREFQNSKWGEHKKQTLLGFVSILRKELQEVEDGWHDDIASGRNSPLHEMVQVAATAVACLEKYGTEGNVTNEDGITYIRK